MYKLDGIREFSRNRRAKKRLLNDSAAEAPEIKRFEDLRASDKERHNSQVESLGNELDTQSVEISKMKQI